MDLFSATCLVLKDIINDPETTMKQHHESNGVYDVITSFEFVFILHLMREIMEYTDDLCQALQRQSQEILKAMHLVTTMKNKFKNLEKMDEFLS